MAAPPVKSQPLHNFSLPQLRWAHKNSSVAGSSSHYHRFRRRDSPDQQQRRDPVPVDGPADPKQQLPDAVEEEEENGETKPWNLRPRKEIIKAAAAGTTSKRETGGDYDNKAGSNSNALRSQRLKDMAEGGQRSGGVERKGKRRVWISLSREEIEEDIYALTGGKPARRPKKWPKNVQKQVDNVFPGSYFVGVAADSYRVMMLWRRWTLHWYKGIVRHFLVCECCINLMVHYTEMSGGGRKEK